MTKKQLRSAGYKAIVKNHKSHQEAFDEINETPGIDQHLLAEELTKIPSSGKQQATTSLRYIFIVSLILIIAMRIYAIVVLGIEGGMNPSLIGVLLLFGILIPGYGIYAALFSKSELYSMVGFLLILGIFRFVTRESFSADPITYIAYIPFAIAIGLAFFIPFKLKTPFKKTVSEHFIDGKMQHKTRYEFEDTRANQSDLLDSKF